MEAIITGDDLTIRARHRRFEDFYRAEWDGVFRPLAVTLGDPDLAREATDEAMVRALQRWGKISSYDNPAGFVYRTGLNWARSRLRKRRREVRPEHAPDTAVLDPEPADPALVRALARLTIDQRAVVVLRYVTDLSQEQIAGLLDVPVGTVRSRLHRALEALRKEVSP